jgi:hypothetical protein
LTLSRAKSRRIAVAVPRAPRFGLTAAKAISGVKGASTKIPLGVLGGGRLFVQALYYVYDAQGYAALEPVDARGRRSPRGKPTSC